MTLDQFKTIYWWEYIHRLLGRLVGLIYLIPLLYFTYKKYIKGKFLILLYTILILIILQGFIGWYMVQSGLTERTDVSHYRLALHLILAFIIYILLVWNYLKYKKQEFLIHGEKIPFYLPLLFLVCVLIQICIGAFVSGLDAGQIYQSWPLMNENYFPDDTNVKILFSTQIFEIPSIVQFIHRNVAYLIIIFFIFITAIVYKNNNLKHLRRTVNLVLVMIFIQTFLGVLTILSGAQIALASMHQIGSIFLVTFSVILLFQNSKIN